MLTLQAAEAYKELLFNFTQTRREHVLHFTNIILAKESTNNIDLTLA